MGKSGHDAESLKRKTKFKNAAKIAYYRHLDHDMCNSSKILKNYIYSACPGDWSGVLV